MEKTAYKVTALGKNKKAQTEKARHTITAYSNYSPALKHGKNCVRSDSRSGKTKKAQTEKARYTITAYSNYSPALKHGEN